MTGLHADKEGCLTNLHIPQPVFDNDTVQSEPFDGGYNNLIYLFLGQALVRGIVY